jgi:Zn-finger nucleic acid-binding protein
MTKLICRGCGFKNTEDEFDVSTNVNYEFICPKCGSINIDTSEINKECEECGQIYEYGKNNTIINMR